MKLIKNNEYNDYTWTGLTLGKLLAILHALEELETQGKLSVIQHDVLIFLHNTTGLGR